MEKDKEKEGEGYREELEERKKRKERMGRKENRKEWNKGVSIDRLST